jgi:hypothetical protein
MKVKKKKKKEKATVRGRQQKSQHISQPCLQVCGVGEQLGQQQQGLESWKHIQSKGKQRLMAGIQDAHRVGLV